MIEKITPHHDEYRNCLEDIFATLAIWKKREYILMHSYSWDFGYISSKVSNDLIGYRMSTSRSGLAYLEKEYILRKYIGIELSEHKKMSIDKSIDMIKQECKNGYPVAIYINSYWCPWNTSYKKHRVTHFCLAVDINEDEIICIDPFYNLKNVMLPLGNYQQGLGVILKFRFLEEYDDENWLEILENCAFRTLTGSNGKSDFDNIREFANEIRYEESAKKEFEVHYDINVSPLLMCVNSIALARKKNASVLFWLHEKYHRNGIETYGEKLEMACSKWLSIKNLMIKYWVSGYSEHVLRAMYNGIIGAADYEENLAHEIYSSVQIT